MSDYTTIAGIRVDADSPVDEDLISDLRDNAASIRERQLRTGTHVTGVRLTLARGISASTTITTDGSGNGLDTIGVGFAGDSSDGDPNFSAAPSCLGLTFEELSTGDDLGGTAPSVSCWINEATLDASGFTAVISVRGGAVTANIDYKLHWAFVGPVTSGE